MNGITSCPGTCKCGKKAVGARCEHGVIVGEPKCPSCLASELGITPDQVEAALVWPPPSGPDVPKIYEANAAQLGM